jgi:hypothetical protein
MKHFACAARSACMACTLAAVVVSPVTGWTAETQPLPPDGTFYGMKLADWASAWCQWLLTIPQNTNPDTRFDKTGLRAGVGQRAPVWFVPSFAPGSSGNRTFTIPEGQAILLTPMFSVHNDDPGASTDDELLSPASDWVDQITLVAVSLDGAPIPDMKPFRVATPVFSMTLPPGSVFGRPVSKVGDGRVAAAGDGYWVLYPPLAPGMHHLDVRAEGTDPLAGGNPYQSHWTFDFLIQKPNDPNP